MLNNNLFDKQFEFFVLQEQPESFAESDVSCSVLLTSPASAGIHNNTQGVWRWCVGLLTIKALT